MSPCHPAEGLQECHRVTEAEYLQECHCHQAKRLQECHCVTMLRLLWAGVKGEQREGENREQFGEDLS